MIWNKKNAENCKGCSTWMTWEVMAKHEVTKETFRKYNNYYSLLLNLKYKTKSQKVVERLSTPLHHKKSQNLNWLSKVTAVIIIIAVSGFDRTIHLRHLRIDVWLLFSVGVNFREALYTTQINKQINPVAKAN